MEKITYLTGDIMVYNKEYERKKYYRRKYSSPKYQNDICKEDRCFGEKCVYWQYCKSPRKRNWKHKHGKV